MKERIITNMLYSREKDICTFEVESFQDNFYSEWKRFKLTREICEQLKIIDFSKIPKNYMI